MVTTRTTIVDTATRQRLASGCKLTHSHAGVVPDFNPNVAGPNITPPTPVLYGLGFVERNVNFSRVWKQLGPGFFIDTELSPTGPKPLCTVTP